MALLKLTQYKLEGSSWPSNGDVSFRFMGTSVGPDLGCTPTSQWNNCPGSSKLTINSPGLLQIYVDGVLKGTAASTINTVPAPRYNNQRDFNTMYGIARVKFNVI
jgi:hypothetical protein